MAPAIIESTRTAGPIMGGSIHGRSVKWIWCVIRTERLMSVAEELNKLNLVGGMTVTDLQGTGHEEASEAVFLGQRFSVRFIPRVKVELAVEAADVDRVKEVILRTARTGAVGDGKLVVVRVMDLMRVRTGERGTSAL